MIERGLQGDSLVVAEPEGAGEHLDGVPPRCV